MVYLFAINHYFCNEKVVRLLWKLRVGDFFNAFTLLWWSWSDFSAGMCQALKTRKQGNVHAG